MNVHHNDTLPEIIEVIPDRYDDDRGHFLETYQALKYAESGIPPRFVQDNISLSNRHVIRGLHYQTAKPQAKLVTALHGEILDVAVDIRKGSDTFGVWTGILLTSENYRQVYLPEGFAHGFAVLSDVAVIMYKCTEYYDPLLERGIAWNDPDIGIDWGIDSPILSVKDAALPRLMNSCPYELHE